MKVHFAQPAFDAQLLRTLSYACHGAADIGECLSTAARIKDNNFDCWFEEWCHTGDRLAKSAKAAEAHNHHTSAHDAFLRASNYYRTAMFFYYADPIDPRLLEAYEKHASTFSKAMDISEMRVEEVSIPFEGGTLPGYFYSSGPSDEPRPTIIANGGYDSTRQELYFFLVPAAVRRGYNILTFDGPGQGELLLRHEMAMRHDWEAVISPVIDYLNHRSDVIANQIALFGISWGGMLAPRAAAFDTRLAALVVNPGQYDALENLNRAFQREGNPNDSPNVDAFIQAAMSDKFIGAKFRSKMFVHRVHSPTELFNEWAKYTLDGIAGKINCPTLVCDSENEHLSAGQAIELFDALQCPKTYLLFSNSEGAGEHCTTGALSLFNQRAFDWLDKTLSNETSEAISLGCSSPIDAH